MNRGSIFLLGAVLMPTAGLGQIDGERLPGIVQKALGAARNLKYSGTRTVAYREGPVLKTRVEHVLKDGPKTRIWFPEGSPNAGLVIVENGPKRLHYMPGTGRVVETPARGDDALKRLAAVLRNPARFEIRVSRGGPVAGLPTRLVDVVDRRGKKVQSLWIEPRSGMVLKRELYDRAGALTGSFEFKSVDFEPKFSPGDFEVARGPKQDRLKATLRELCRRHGFEPLALADGHGYRLRAVRVLNPQGRAPVLMQSYAGPDGALTLFQVSGEVDPKRLGRLARDRASAHVWKANGKSLVLIGSAEPNELVRLASLVGRP